MIIGWIRRLFNKTTASRAQQTKIAHIPQGMMCAGSPLYQCSKCKMCGTGFDCDRPDCPMPQTSSDPAPKHAESDWSIGRGITRHHSNCHCIWCSVASPNYRPQKLAKISEKYRVYDK